MVGESRENSGNDNDHFVHKYNYNYLTEFISICLPIFSLPVYCNGKTSSIKKPGPESRI